MGVYLIQSVALVAPVPRTEDIGIDVVATLIRDDDRYSYIAEDSFYVQIKTSTISKIEYDQDGVKWLYDLKLPFFIASVDRNKSSIKLYTTKRIFDAFAIEKDKQRINIILDKEEEYKIYDFVEKGCEDIYTGPPIFEWSVKDLMTDERKIKEKFYKLLKEHTRLINESMELQEIGLGSTYTWITNEMPSFYSWKASSNSNIDFKLIIEKLMNYLNKALDICSVVGTRSVFEEVQSTLEFYETVYENYESVRRMSRSMKDFDIQDRE